MPPRPAGKEKTDELLKMGVELHREGGNVAAFKKGVLGFRYSIPGKAGTGVCIREPHQPLMSRQDIYGVAGLGIQQECSGL